MRIDLLDMFDAERFHEADEIKFAALAILQGHAVEGIALTTGHRRRAIVKDAYGSCAFVAVRQQSITASIIAALENILISFCIIFYFMFVFTLQRYEIIRYRQTFSLGKIGSKAKKRQPNRYS